MAYNDLNSFVRALEQAGELKRVVYPVKAELEITEIADRVMKSGGPALLFENVIGKQIPVLINAFGSTKTHGAGVGSPGYRRNRRRDHQANSNQTAQDRSKTNCSYWRNLVKLAGIPPKMVKDGACQEVILREPDLNILPVLTCWPGDAGPFITLPMVFSKDPVKGTRNVGLYRMQVFDARTTGMHWHLHKVGARHFQQQKEHTGSDGAGSLPRRRSGDDLCRHRAAAAADR